MKSAIVFFLLVISNGWAETRNFTSLCPGLLLEQPFLQPLRYARHTHRHLKPVNLGYLRKLHWPFQDQQTLDHLAQNFSHGKKGSKIILKLELHVDEAETRPHVVTLLTFFKESDSAHPIGFAAYLIKFSKTGELEAHNNGTYFAPDTFEAKGISPVIRKFMDVELFKKAGVVREKLLADSTGRYVWAKVYRFDRRKYFWKGKRFESETMKPLEMVRANFERFLDWHRISLTDLVIRIPGKSGEKEKAVHTIEDFEEPQDFAYAFHKRGRKVRITPLIADDTLGLPSPMPIGKAFLLSDYRPQAGEPFISSPMGTRFSDRAMPKWYAVREIP